MRGNTVVQGDYNAPKENLKVFRDGWMYTGDTGVIHNDGYLELKDRFKDIIISSGCLSTLTQQGVDYVENSGA